MAKKNTIKFAKVEFDLINSCAWHDLPFSAVKIMHFVWQQQVWKDVQPNLKKAKWVCVNKEDIVLPYKVFQRHPYKMHQSSITRGIDSLLAHGFVELKEQGGAYRGQTSKFKVSDAWKSWKKGDILFKRKPFIARGFCKKTD